MSSSIQQETDTVGGAEPVNPAPNPVRRSFTAEYRARVVAEYEAAPHGEKAGVLRREGFVPVPGPRVEGRAGRSGGRCGPATLFPPDVESVGRLGLGRPDRRLRR